MKKTHASRNFSFATHAWYEHSTRFHVKSYIGSLYTTVIPIVLVEMTDESWYTNKCSNADLKLQSASLWLTEGQRTVMTAYITVGPVHANSNSACEVVNRHWLPPYAITEASWLNSNNEQVHSAIREQLKTLTTKSISWLDRINIPTSRMQLPLA